MPTAVDFSFSRPTVAQLRAAGVALVIRYLTGSGKAISRAELQSYLAAGIVVVFVFEVAATDGTSGYAAGAAHAQQASAALVALGLPASTPVYFAADADIVTPSDVLAYWQGIASVRPASTNGVYGEGALCTLLDGDGLAVWFWQSESTSFPGNASTLPITHIQQRVAGAPLAGTDLDVLLRPDVGQYPRPAEPAPAPPAPLPPLPPPTHYAGDSMTSYAARVSINDGKGWVASPVPASKIVSVVVQTRNPEVVNGYPSVPTIWAVATEAGKDSPNGAVTVEGMIPNGVYGLVIWAVD